MAGEEAREAGIMAGQPYPTAPQEVDLRERRGDQGRPIGLGEQRVLINPSRFYPVIVHRVANGFILDIGCKTFVAKTWEEAAAGLADYYTDPKAAQEKYCKQ